MGKKRSKRARTHEDGYEFSGAENKIIASVSARTKWWGVISLSLGALVALLGVFVLASPHGGLTEGAPFLLIALAPIVTGKAYLDAGASLESVVRTEGDDMPHMMTAVTRITTAVRMEIVAAIVVVVAGLALGVSMSSRLH